MRRCAGIGPDLGRLFALRVSQLGREVLCRCPDDGHGERRGAAGPGRRAGAGAVTSLRLMILCGRSARHLHVANALCRAGEVVAIVQETGGDWRLRQTLRKLRPDKLARKAWRWVRDRRRYRGNPEARFFFPDGPPRLERPDLVREVPHINHPDVARWARELQPDLICVFGTSLIRGELLQQG